MLPAALLAAPRLNLSPVAIDAGNVEVGTPITGRFEVVNDGDAPLELSIEVPSGVTLKHVDRQLAPQARGTIQIEASTTGISINRPRFKLVVKSNDPERAETAVELRALLRFPLNAQPSYVRIVGVRGETARLTIKVTSSDGTPFRIVEAVPQNAPIKVDVGAAPAALNQELVVTVAPDPKVGPIAGWLDLRTDHPKRAEIRLPVSGIIRPTISATPAEIDFGNIAAGAPRTLSLLLKSHSATAVEFKAPTCDSPLITLASDQKSAAGEFPIRITLTPSTTPGPFTTKVRVGTSHPDMPTVEIPVRATIR